MPGSSPGMTSWVCLGVSRHTFTLSPRVPRELIKIPALTTKGAGNAGGSNTPAASRADKKAHEFVTTGLPNDPGIPRAMVLTVSFVVSLVIGLCCHHPRRNASALSLG
jgi:cytochrome c biogenesis protein ResB